MTRTVGIKIYRNALLIFKQSRLSDVRRAAKEIAVEIEKFLGQLGSQPAETWEVD